MVLKRQTRRESLIGYLLQPPTGAPLRRSSARQSLVGAIDPSDSIDEIRASYEAMSDAQIDVLVAKKRQQEDDAARTKMEIEEKALALKMAEEDRALFFNQPGAIPDFRYWGKLACWSFDEAVALSFGKNPDVVNVEALFSDSHVSAAHKRSSFPRQYARRHEQVRRASTMLQLSDPVQPKTFLTWARPIFDSLPDELLEEVGAEIPTVDDLKRLTARIAELESVLESNAEAAIHSWPWGHHETDLLRKLAAAASKFWVLYDPEDGSTAPTNDQVGRWLQKEGVSKNIATAMATILRADGIVPGPRK